MFNTVNKTLGYKQLVLIALAPVGVFIAMSCEFLLALGLLCCCCGLLVGRGNVDDERKRRNETLPQQPHAPLPTKSPQQQHPNPSANKNLQRMAIDTSAGTNAISASCLQPNVWLSVLHTLLALFVCC